MVARTRSARNTFDIWPGFVDALSSLLIIILFVSMVFMTAQFFLGNALSGRDKKINQLNTRIDQLARMLALEQAKGDQARKTLSDIMAELKATITARDKLLDERSQLRTRLAGADKEREALTKTLGQLEARREMLKALIEKAEKANKELEKRVAAIVGDREDLRRKMAALSAEKSELEKKMAGVTGEKTALEKSLSTLAERNEALAARMAQISGTMKALQDKLAQALAENRVLKAQLEEAKKTGAGLKQDLEAQEKRSRGLIVRAEEAEKATKDARELTDKQAQEIVVLNRQLAAIRQQLRAIQEALEASEAKRKGQEVRIEDLSSRLNAALATKVQELQRYRSEFFGRLREALGNRSDIKIVGDRFVFQSEVLFPTGSDELQEGGREQLAKLAATLKEIGDKIPKDIDWVLRVDGHTDIRPIRTETFGSNWELSAARAIAVVKYLIEEGIPPKRLVAAGFGEFQPLDTARTEEAYARNRRIELKITNR